MEHTPGYPKAPLNWGMSCRGKVTYLQSPHSSTPTSKPATALTAPLSLSQIANNQNSWACIPWPPTSLTIFQCRNKRYNAHRNINTSNNVLRKKRVRTPAATSWGELLPLTGRVRPVTKPLSSTHYDPRQGCLEFASRVPQTVYGTIMTVEPEEVRVMMYPKAPPLPTASGGYEQAPEVSPSAAISCTAGIL